MYGNTGDVTSHHHHHHHHLLPSSSAAAAENPTITYPLLYHHQQQELHQTIMIPLPPPFDGAADEDEFPRRDERLPHWSNQETRDLIEMRAQVEWGFAAAKGNRNLWEMVAERMREKGYWRTADQCKWKWKNLVSRYKGQEASDVDSVPPFFNELHAVFTARANRMQQAQAEAEAVIGTGRKRLNDDASEDQSNEEFTEDQEEVEVDPQAQAGKARAVPKRREKRQKTRQKEAYVNKNESMRNGIREIMRTFMQQQQMIDMEWRASMEKRAEERERFEQEWQQKMERLERERLMIEQAWRAREEDRRQREESRAEQRDALLTVLLNKLLNEEETTSA